MGRQTYGFYLFGHRRFHLEIRNVFKHTKHILVVKEICGSADVIQEQCDAIEQLFITGLKQLNCASDTNQI